MSTSREGGNITLDAVGGQVAYAALFDQDPLNDTATEISGGSYARIPVSLHPADDAHTHVREDMLFDVPDGASVGGVGLLDAQTGGTLLGGRPTDLTHVFSGAGVFRVSYYDLYDSTGEDFGRGEIADTVDAENNRLDALGGAGVWVSAHDGDPGLTGANEVGTERAQVAWDPASGGAKLAPGEFSVSVPSGTVVTHCGLWDSSSGGTFLCESSVTNQTSDGSVTFRRARLV